MSDGDTFTPLNYGSVSGDFGSQNLPTDLEATVDPTGLFLLAVIGAVNIIDPAVDTDIDPLEAEDFAYVDDEIAELFREFEDEISHLENSGSEEDEDEDERAELTEEDAEELEFSGTLVCS